MADNSTKVPASSNEVSEPHDNLKKVGSPISPVALPPTIPSSNRGFGEIKYKPSEANYTVKVAQAINTLTESVLAKIDFYLDTSLLAALERSLPFDIRSSLASYSFRRMFKPTQGDV